MTARTLEALAIGLVLGLLAGLTIGVNVHAATPRSQAEPVPSWAPVVLPSEAPPLQGTLPVWVAPTQPDSGGDDGGASSEPTAPGARTASEPDATAQASPRPSVRRTPVPTRATAPPRAGAGVTGPASWFCQPGVSACTVGYPASGLFAAAGPALRVGAWRGRTVTVDGLRVRLIDFCGCPDGRVIDLYASAFRQLAPLGAGVIQVRVTW